MWHSLSPWFPFLGLSLALGWFVLRPPPPPPSHHFPNQHSLCLCSGWRASEHLFALIIILWSLKLLLWRKLASSSRHPHKAASPSSPALCDTQKERLCVICRHLLFIGGQEKKKKIKVHIWTRPFLEALRWICYLSCLVKKHGSNYMWFIVHELPVISSMNKDM